MWPVVAFRVVVVVGCSDTEVTQVVVIVAGRNTSGELEQFFECCGNFFAAGSLARLVHGRERGRRKFCRGADWLPVQCVWVVRHWESTGKFDTGKWPLLTVKVK